MELFLDSILEGIKLLVSLDRYILEVILLSLRVSGTAVLIAVVIGLPLGLWLGLARFRGRGVLAALVNTGLGLPPVVVGLVVYMMLSRRGPLGFLELLYTPGAMTGAQVLIAGPYVTAITMAAVGSIPRDLRQQALGLGASRVQALWLVVREARVSIMAAVVAGFGAAISEVGAVMMVGGNIATAGSNETRTMTTAIVQETGMGHYERALALGMILLLIAFAVNVFLTRNQEGVGGRWLKS